MPSTTSEATAPLADAPVVVAAVAATLAVVVSVVEVVSGAELDVVASEVIAGSDAVGSVAVTVPFVGYGGGEVAVLGSVRTPVPHGIGAFEPGCVFSLGGVVCPCASAMANLPVQSRVVVFGEVNW